MRISSTDDTLDSFVIKHGVMPIHKAMKIFHSFLACDECPNDIGPFTNWCMHEAHKMYRNDEISGDEFAIIMDEVICY